MASKKKAKSNNKFAPLFKYVANSPAWEALSNSARVAYMHLLLKKNNSHQNEVTLSYREMRRIMSEPAYGRAIKQLEKIGFIEVTGKGGLFRKRNFYSFSYRWKEYPQ